MCRYVFSLYLSRLFQVELLRDEDSIFADDAIFENGVGAAIDYDREKVYVGRLADTPHATVHGIVDAEGSFDGHISTPSETYYVEPAHR